MDVFVEGVLTLFDTFIGAFDIGSLKGRASVHQGIHDDPQGPDINFVGMS